MSDLNKVLLIGNLGDKPEVKQVASGDNIARMRVATSHRTQTQGQVEKETEWHTVVAFGKLADLCGEYLEKGRLVYVEGTLRSHAWKDKDGQSRTDHEIRASQVRFLGPARRQEQGAYAQAAA